jgi:hypothetical protein
VDALDLPSRCFGFGVSTFSQFQPHPYLRLLRATGASKAMTSFRAAAETPKPGSFPIAGLGVLGLFDDRRMPNI